MNMEHKFSKRVEDYVKYRPTYPREAIDYLYEHQIVSDHSTVADIGAGTGIFSKLLVERGTHVIAVEPDPVMRNASMKAIGDDQAFNTTAGTAETTGLEDHSVDAITCAQSFHWFDRVAVKEEFSRILKPGGKVALIWNKRQITGTSFMEGLEEVWHRYGIDYSKVNHKNIADEDLQAFFTDNTMHKARFQMQQTFDFEGLRGRVKSSSYTPMPEHENYEPMMAELQRLFNRYEQNGEVPFLYETELFWGRVDRTEV
nr:class I SAM-dependent methyltransferase [Geomicrobium sp. JCM 19055]